AGGAGAGGAGSRGGGRRPGVGRYADHAARRGRGSVHARAVRAVARSGGGGRPGHQPAGARAAERAVARAAAALAADLERSDSLVTLFRAHVDPSEGRVRFADAGHAQGLSPPALGEALAEVRCADEAVARLFSLANLSTPPPDDLTV